MISLAPRPRVTKLNAQRVSTSSRFCSPTRGLCDLVRRERAGRHLVEQRLEQVEVATIDERDLDRRAPETAHGLKAAETSPHNDHPMSSIRFTHS